MNPIKDIENKIIEKPSWPKFHPGDTISVDYTIREGSKERVQRFKGTVIERKGSGATETFTVRKVTQGIGIERIFPVRSPFIKNITVNKHGKVRRARIHYLRDKFGKAARIPEKKKSNKREV